jgi:hypothetical protein
MDDIAIAWLGFGRPDDKRSFCNPVMAARALFGRVFNNMMITLR